jgi:hypothetical protein
MRSLLYVVTLSCFFSTPTFAEVQFVFSEDVSAQSRENIQSGITIGDAFFQRQLGVEIQSNIRVVASGSPAFLRANSPRSTYDPSCNGGFANARVIVLCTQSEAFNRDQFAGGLRLQQEIITLHEYVHILQIELTGGPLNDPRWLTEGFAEYVVLLHKAETRQTNLRQELRHHSSSAREAGLVLSMIESNVGFRASPWSSSAGMIACQKLEEIAGIVAFRDYWLKRRQGENWQTAFVEAFGLTVEEFYNDFRL